MDSIIPSDLGQLSFRWLHVVAGVLWIGLLYFFNFVNSAFAPTMDGETKKKVVPELMPRALFWFRWGAAFTWLSGVSLMMLLYYSSSAPPYYFASDSEHIGTPPEFSQWILPFALVVVLYAVYDVLAKSLAKQPLVTIAVWELVALAFGYWLDTTGMSNRAIYIHLGGLLGTAMAANVWMRIWPCQRRIITAIKSGQAPNAADVALAGLRSKHNTFMSVPLLLFMVSVHQDGMLAAEPWYGLTAIVFIVGLVATEAMYRSVPKVKGF